MFMGNINLFQEGYNFASNTEKTFDDMHSKFESVQGDVSVFMLGYAFYLIETAKYLDGASTESLSAKLNIGIAQQCIDSVATEKNLSSDDTMELFSKLNEMALNSSLEDVFYSVVNRY
jgi:hypothetical protein